MNLFKNLSETDLNPNLYWNCSHSKVDDFFISQGVQELEQKDMKRLRDVYKMLNEQDTVSCEDQEKYFVNEYIEMMTRTVNNALEYDRLQKEGEAKTCTNNIYLKGPFWMAGNILTVSIALGFNVFTPKYKEVIITDSDTKKTKREFRPTELVPMLKILVPTDQLPFETKQTA